MILSCMSQRATSTNLSAQTPNKHPCPSWLNTKIISTNVIRQTYSSIRQDNTHSLPLSQTSIVRSQIALKLRKVRRDLKREEEAEVSRLTNLETRQRISPKTSGKELSRLWSRTRLNSVHWLESSDWTMMTWLRNFETSSARSTL